MGAIRGGHVRTPQQRVALRQPLLSGWSPRWCARYPTQMSHLFFPSTPYSKLWMGWESNLGFRGGEEGQLDPSLVRDDSAQRLHPRQPAFGEAGSDLVRIAIELFDLRTHANRPGTALRVRGHEGRRALDVFSPCVAPWPATDGEWNVGGKLGNHVRSQRRIELETRELRFESASLGVRLPMGGPLLEMLGLERLIADYDRREWNGARPGDGPTVWLVSQSAGHSRADGVDALSKRCVEDCAEVAVSRLRINVQHLASVGARGDSNHDKGKHFSVHHLHSHILAIGATGSGTVCSIAATPARGPAAMVGCAVARERV